MPEILSIAELYKIVGAGSTIHIDPDGTVRIEPPPALPPVPDRRYTGVDSRKEWLHARIEELATGIYKHCEVGLAEVDEDNVAHWAHELADLVKELRIERDRAAECPF